MEHNVNKAYILTSQELTLIAAGKGIIEFFSLAETIHPMDEMTVCKVMSNLYQKGVLKNSGDDSFCLEEDLNEMMEVIANAERMVLIRDFITKDASQILYIGKNPVIMEKSQVDKDGIRLYEIDQNELRCLVEAGIHQNIGEWKQVLDEEGLLREILRSPTVLQEEKADYLGNAIMMFEGLRKGSERVAWRILLIQGKVQKELLCYDRENHSMVKYEGLTVDAVMNRIWED